MKSNVNLDEMFAKPERTQFPTFRGNKRDLDYVKSLADKYGMSYARVMNAIVLIAKDSLEDSEYMGLGENK